MRVLVTNDDGLHAPGITHLAIAARDAGHEVLMVAPGSNFSGSGAAIGDLGEQSRVRCREMELAGLEDVESIELDAPPALCVITALLGAFGERPDFVLSGINPGLNTGPSTLHSGTVGAVLTAANFGLSGVAVSIEGHEPEVVNWTNAARSAVSAAEWIEASPQRISLNLSLPDVPAEELAGVTVGSLAPMGAVHTEVQRRDDEWLQLGFARTTRDLPAGSDSKLVSEGYMVITALNGVRASEIDDEERLISHLATPDRGER